MRVDPTNRTDEINEAVKWLFRTHWNGERLRSVAVRVSKVSKPVAAQISLFEPVETTQHIDALEQTMDKIRAKWGYKAIFRASSKTTGGTALERASLVGGHAK